MSLEAARLLVSCECVDCATGEAVAEHHALHVRLGDGEWTRAPGELLVPARAGRSVHAVAVRGTSHLLVGPREFVHEQQGADQVTALLRVRVRRATLECVVFERREDNPIFRLEQASCWVVATQNEHTELGELVLDKGKARPAQLQLGVPYAVIAISEGMQQHRQELTVSERDYEGTHPDKPFTCAVAMQRLQQATSIKSARTRDQERFE